MLGDNELLKSHAYDIYGALTFYREVGYYMKRLEMFETSLKYFDEAVKRKQDDIRTLRGRAVALAQSCKYKEAQNDVRAMLNIKPDDIYAFSIQAIVMFLACDFAQALIVNKRYSKLRKKPTNFIMGLMHCADAIQNSVGPRAGHPLRNHYKYVRRIGWRIAIEKQKPWAPVAKKRKKKKKERIPENQPVMPLRKIKMPLLRRRSKTKGSKRSLHKQSKSVMVDKKDIPGGEHGGNDAVPSKLQGTQTEAEQFKHSKKRKSKSRGRSEQSTSRTETNTTTSRNHMGNQTPHESPSERLVVEPSMSSPLFEIGSSIEDTLHSHVDSGIKIPKMGPYPFRPLQNYTTNIRNYMAENYLDKMYLDKIYLKGMPKILGIANPNEEGSRQIKKLAKYAFKLVDYNQELLRARKPFYGIKFRSTKMSGRMKERLDDILVDTKLHCSNKAENLLDNMKKAIDVGALKDLIELAEKLRVYCQNTPRKWLPRCDEYLHSLYNMMCDGYYNSLKFTDDMTDADKLSRIHVILGLPMVREPSHDELFAQFKNVFWDYRKMTMIHEERLRNAIDIDEIQWLYYNLARFQIELGKYDLARAYATKCMKEAYKVKNYKWIVNSFFLIVRADVLSKDKNNAKVSIRKTERVAKKLHDPVMIDVIQLAKETINNSILAEIMGTALIQKRQKKIINIQRTQKMKDTAAHLFRQIGALSVERRMSVIPGILYELDGKRPRPLQLPDDTSRGSTFMQLIQFHLD